jgi:hypothetical protein
MASSNDERIITPAFTSYKEVLEYFRRFLNREIEDSPCDSFEDETEMIQSQLLAINAAGILSFSSQPGTNEVVSQPPVIYECDQRAYLSCYMNRDLAYKLFYKFRGSDILVFVSELGNLLEFEDIPNEEQTETPKVLSDKSTIDVSSTTKITYDPKTNIKLETTVNPETSITPIYKFQDLEIILMNTSEEPKQIITKDLVQVHFIDWLWGREIELFDRLVALLA